MATEHTAAQATLAPVQAKTRRRLPSEVNILLVLIGIALIYEVLGWIFVGQSFLMNQQRLTIMILQVSVIGIIAVGVTQVIITGGIDLSSGSVVGMTAMIAASFAQSSTWARAVYPSLTDLPFVVPMLVGLGIGLLAGLINGALISYTKIPPFIATLGHDGFGARHIEVVHQGSAGLRPRRTTSRSSARASGRSWCSLAWRRSSMSRCATRATANSPMPSAPTCRRRASPASMSNAI